MGILNDKMLLVTVELRSGSFGSPVDWIKVRRQLERIGEDLVNLQPVGHWQREYDMGPGTGREKPVRARITTFQDLRAEEREPAAPKPPKPAPGSFRVGRLGWIVWGCVVGLLFTAAFALMYAGFGHMMDSALGQRMDPLDKLWLNNEIERLDLRDDGFSEFVDYQHGLNRELIDDVHELRSWAIDQGFRPPEKK
jgi:hypothetical protein